MTETQREELGKRAVACKNFRWLPGMLALPCASDRLGLRSVPVRVVHVYEGDGIAVWGDISGVHGSWEEWRWREEGRLPDLQDSATLGCMMALVREVWKSPVAQTSPTLPDIIFWTCYINNEADGDHRFRAETEGEALVMALEGVDEKGDG